MINFLKRIGTFTREIIFLSSKTRMHTGKVLTIVNGYLNHFLILSGSKIAFLKKPLIIIPLSFLLTSALFADDRIYDIELVIFQNIKTAISKNNYWKPEILAPILSNAITLSSTDNTQITTDVLRQLPGNKSFTELPSKIGRPF